jgi:N-acyl-phosphatidylethanolamine-hydrolysing phospholipase D
MICCPLRRIVPLGVKAILASNGITNCKELNWWESVTIPCKGRNENIEVILTPAKHWSSRTLFDRNTTLWGSFSVIHKDCRLFFGGDTAYCPIFKTIGEKYGPFDISLIPIGAYKPRSILKDAHCDPAEAIQIHFDLKSKTSLGIHWGTFNLADDESVEPPLELGRIRNSIRLSSKEFFTAMHGETISISQASQFDIASLYPELLTRYSNYLLQNISYLDKFEFEIINSSTNRSTFVTSFEKSSLN